MKKGFWAFLHPVIILNYLVGAFYAAYMVFFGVGGRKGPLFNQAEELPTEIVVKRRLYAIEFWVALGGLTTYLGLTELLKERLGEGE